MTYARSLTEIRAVRLDSAYGEVTMCLSLADEITRSILRLEFEVGVREDGLIWLRN